MGKGDKKRRHKRHRRAKSAITGFRGYAPPATPQSAPEASTGGLTMRPTDQRMARGKWALPKGMGKHDQPAVDLEADAVGLMYERGFITTQQEQAARTVQRAYAEYVSELGVSQGRSCLDISPVGHDDSDGNPEAMAAWRAITAKLSYWQRGALEWTVINNHAPGNLELLRSALDAVAGIRQRVAAE